LIFLSANYLWCYAEPLINAGSDIDVRHEHGRGMMYYAATCDNVATINLLLEKGADINVQTYESDGGQTALHGAVDYNYIAVVRVLLEKGADVNISASRGTPLQLAETKGHYGIANLIKEEIEKRKRIEGLTIL
jgi:ankyrin repeat protein